MAAGGNFAILNRLVIFEQIADAFRKVFEEDLELHVILVPGSASGEVVAGPWPGPVSPPSSALETRAILR